jgi:hypothetical protein
MGWYKFTISNEQMAPVETQRIQKKFDQIWWPLSCPRGTAVYAKKTATGASVAYYLTYYLTPSCEKSAKALIADYAAKECEQPDKDSLIFIAGDSSFINWDGKRAVHKYISAFWLPAIKALKEAPVRLNRKYPSSLKASLFVNRLFYCLRLR